MKKTGLATEHRQNTLLSTTASMPPRISTEALAILGQGKIAYVRTLKAADAKKMFPVAQGNLEEQRIPEDATLHCVFSASGGGLFLCNDKASASTMAFQSELELVSVH